MNDSFISKIRKDFPILEQKVYGKPLIYLDNGATTQKPKQVIDAVNKFYAETNSNIHRGVHFLSEKSTIEYENARKTVQEFINAKSEKEIIFTKGTTDSINLVAYSFTEKYISEGDEIIVSEMEHHSNIVPWQLACERKNAKLKIIPINDNGEIIYDEFEKLLTKKTRIVAITHISNSLGTINPIKKIIDKAHKYNVPVLIDAAQSIQHEKIDVQELDCDFLAFSGHKIYAETGIGVLYGKEKFLNEIPPYQGGGDMIKTVSFTKTTYADLPLKFEAGTANYVGAISLNEAIKYLQNTGFENIIKHEKKLLDYATEKLLQVSGLKIIGTAEQKASLISFNLGEAHNYDVGTLLDKMGIAVRTGTHCCQPVMQRFGIAGTVRASFAFYNTFDEIDNLQNALIRISKIL